MERGQFVVEVGAAASAGMTAAPNGGPGVRVTATRLGLELTPHLLRREVSADVTTRAGGVPEHEARSTVRIR